MSYDLYLRNPVTKDELTVPGHLMYGGNVMCDYIDGAFIPKPTTEAYLNITYNYGRYYYEAFPRADKESNNRQHESDVAAFMINPDYAGIRILNGVSGVDAVQILEEMIRRIENRYKRPDGTWVVTTRERDYYINRATGQREGKDFFALGVFLRLRSESATDEEASQKFDELYERHTETYEMNEGSCGEDYWSETAANAIKPLYQLIALSKLRPDGVWSEES